MKRILQSVVIRRWLPPLLWMGIIYYFSSIPDLQSEFASQIDFVLRKGAHMLEYAVLAILIANAHPQQRAKKAVLLFGLLGALLYAMSDEWHQSFVPGRVASWRDVATDTVGILIGLALYDRWRVNQRSLG